MSRCLSAVLCILVCTEISAQQQDSAPSVSFTINEMDSSLVLGSDRRTRLLRLTLRVTIRNESQSVVKLDLGQFRLLADGRPVAPAQPDTGEAFPQSILQPLQVSTGLLWYSGIAFNGEEIPLTLQWTRKPGEPPTVPDAENANRPNTENANKEDSAAAERTARDVFEVDLNKELRRLNKTQTWSVGPQGELQMISVHRNLDILSAWTFREELQQLSAKGIQRVLFTPAPGAKAGVTDEFTLWLSTMVDGGALMSGQALPTPLPKAGVMFKHIALAEFEEVAGRPVRVGTRSVQQHRSIDDAVCVALTPLYRFVPVEQAITDLSSPNAGIRRAAMAGAVDRLTADQAVAILERAHSGSENLQLEVASYLNLIPGKASVDALREMSLGDNPKVAAVAMRSLTRSHDDSAEVAMAEIWKAGETTPSLQSQLVQAIVESPDDRWVPLVADYVSVFLRQAAQPDSATIPAESIEGALRFLQQRGGLWTDSEIRHELPGIRNPRIQDLFLQHLMDARDSGNEHVIRQCVTHRLNEGQISITIAHAASQYRDAAWTDGLLAGFTAAGSDNRSSPQFLQAALECATNEQLNAMAEKLDQFGLHHRTELLQHLARINHPTWRQLAAQLLTNPHERCSEVIQLLAQDASEESLLILRTRLETYVARLEGTPDASVEGQHFFQTLMAHLSMFVHPECRRVMNRMTRNPSTYVNERAGRLKADAFRRSPAFRLMLAETQQRREGKEDEADLTLKECLDADPLLPDVYVRRASVAMHAEHFAESMVDLKIADRLSPEDIEVQSMMALVMVRMDDIEKGLEYAEQTIAMGAQDWTSLYNGACTFARATESVLPTPEFRQSYANRAIELLRQTAALKFSDSEHMLKDADLNSLHEHAEWANIVALVNANKDPAPDAPKNDQ